MAHDGRVREPRPSYYNYTDSRVMQCVTWFSNAENQTKYVESQRLKRTVFSLYSNWIKKDNISETFIIILKLPLNRKCTWNHAMFKQLFVCFFYEYIIVPILINCYL